MNTIQTRVLDTADVHIVHEAVAKANKKAAKLGQPGFEVTTIPTEPRPIVVPDPLDPGSWKLVGYIEQSEVTVTGTPPRIAGWTFVATLEWEGEQVVIRKPEGLDVDTTAAREHLQVEWCDHCNSRRQRSNTYLLLSDDGAWKQVGSTCLREFLGVEVNLSLLGFNPYDGVEDNSPRRPERYATIATLVDVLALIRAYGWVSSSAAYYDGSKTATKDRLKDAWWDRRSNGAGEQARQAIRDHHREGDEDYAKAVLAWVRENTQTSEYISNLKAALSGHEVRTLLDGTVVEYDSFAITNLGLVVSAVSSYDRARQREEERKATATGLNEHVGTVKERLRGLRLTVKTVRYFESDYGTTCLLILRDAQGRAFKWFASNFEASEGETLVLDGTVKGHEEYNGLKSTVLTRCKAQEVAA